MRTHDLRAATAVDDVLQSPRSRQTFDARTMSCNSCDTSTAIAVFEMPYHHPCATTHVRTKATSRTAQYHHHTCTICQRKVPMAVTVVKQRHVQTLVAQKHLDANVWNDLLSCKSASESSSSMSQAFKRQKASKRQSSNERPRASNIP